MFSCNLPKLMLSCNLPRFKEEKSLCNFISTQSLLIVLFSSQHQPAHTCVTQYLNNTVGNLLTLIRKEKQCVRRRHGDNVRYFSELGRNREQQGLGDQTESPSVSLVFKKTLRYQKKNSNHIQMHYNLSILCLAYFFRKSLFIQQI